MTTEAYYASIEEIEEDLCTIQRLLTTYRTAGYLDRLHLIREVFLLLQKPLVLMGICTEQVTFPTILRSIIDDLRLSHLCHLDWFATLRRVEVVVEDAVLSDFSRGIMREALTRCTEHDAGVLAEYYRLEADIVQVEAALAVVETL